MITAGCSVGGSDLATAVIEQAGPIGFEGGERSAALEDLFFIGVAWVEMQII